MTSCQLYVFSPRLKDVDAFIPELTKALETRKIACFCLRLLDSSEASLKKAVHKLCPLVQSYNCAFLIQASPEIALELGTDGVHLKAEEISVKELRAQYGDELIIGVDCGDSVHLAIDAGEFGADYVFFGPMAENPHQPSLPPIDENMPQWWARLTEVPCVIGGGINAQNIEHFMSIGTEFVALSSALFDKDGPNLTLLEKFPSVADN